MSRSTSPADRIDEYYEKLTPRASSARASSTTTTRRCRRAWRSTPTTFVRSIYFYDPDGIALEFAAWTRELPRDGDVKHKPARAEDAVRYREMAEAK